MKRKSIPLLVVTALIASISVGTGGPQYSGVYSGTIGPAKFLAAATAGRRMIGVDATTSGLGDTLDPARSMVSTTGRIVAATPRGTTMVAQISAKFALTGTAKRGRTTYRLSGKRIYK